MKKNNCCTSILIITIILKIIRDIIIITDKPPSKFNIYKSRKLFIIWEFIIIVYKNTFYNYIK